MDLVVIIVTFNSRDTISACLESLLDNVGGLSSEVWVVDNHSADGTVAVVARQFPQVHVIPNHRNVGFAAACNQGLLASSGRHVLLLNPDTVVESCTLRAMSQFLDSRPGAGIVGCGMLDGHGQHVLSCYPPLSLPTIVWSHWQLNKVLPSWVQGKYRKRAQQPQNAPFRVGWVMGACLMFKRELVATVGLLDEGYFLFAEEADYCRRAWSAGWETWFIPSHHVVHLGGRSTEPVPLVRLANYYLSKLHYFDRHYGRTHRLALKAVFVVDLLARMLVRTAQAAAGSVRARQSLAIYMRILALVLRHKAEPTLARAMPMKGTTA